MRVDDKRITELEIRYTLQQDLLHQLSDVLARHEREIEALRKELERLRQQVTSRDGALPFDPDEKPPHY